MSLEEVTEDAIVIDTSAVCCSFGEGLVKQLKRGAKGFNAISQKDIDAHAESLAHFYTFYQKNPDAMVILPEVISELEHFVQTYNSGLQSHAFAITSPRSKLTRHIVKRRKEKGKRTTYDPSSYSDQSREKLQSLSSLGKDIHRVVSTLQRNVFPRSFSPNEQKVYADVRSFLKQYPKDRATYGGRLETDAKIVASACALGVDLPTAIVSNDSGIHTWTKILASGPQSYNVSPYSTFLRDPTIIKK